MALNTFRALRNRNYRIFFTGQSISLLGTWLQQTAMSWLVYRLTGAAFMLGLVGFLNQIPSFVITPLAGVMADRVDRRKILIMTQGLAMFQAVLLAGLVLTGTIQVWHIMVLSVYLGLVNSVDLPIRQSIVVDFLENREDLGNAIALNSSMFNAARLIGPGIAGLVIAFAGEGVCFLANALSYLAVITSLANIRYCSISSVRSAQHPLTGFKEGICYVLNSQPIKAILLLVAAVSFLGVPYAMLMPVFARDVFSGGPQTLGLLMGTIGAGALLGALYLASRKSIEGLESKISVFAMVFAGGLVLFSRTHTLPFALPLLFICGFSVIGIMASCNTVLQTIVEDDKRGRVMSLYSMAFMGIAPLGSISAGFLADKAGAGNAILTGGILFMAAAGLFRVNLKAIRRHIQPYYKQKMQVPPIASGLQSASDLTSGPKE